MSSRAESEDILVRYFVANVPFISISVGEQARGLDIIKNAVERCTFLSNCYVYSITECTYDLMSYEIVNDSSNVYDALTYFRDRIREDEEEGIVLVLTNVMGIEEDCELSRALCDLARLSWDWQGRIIALTNDPIWTPLKQLGMSIKVDNPSEDEMYEMINFIVEADRENFEINWDDEDVREIASILSGLTERQARNIVGSLYSRKNVDHDDIIEIIQQKNDLFSNMAGLEKIDVPRSSQNVGGLDGLKKWLAAKKPLFTPEKREKLKKLGLQPPRGVLLTGVPGCGKSMSAKTIAADWNLPLYRLDFATVRGIYVGQSEKQLKDALDAAEDLAPCVLWIDEIEKGLNAKYDSSGTTATLTGQFLFWLQECKKQVFIVATANDVSTLPVELLRRGRFDEIFFVDLPTEKERGEIITLYMYKYLGLEMEADLLADFVEVTEGFTGADIESVIRDLAYHTVSNDGFEVTEEETIFEAFNNIIPLSQVNPEQIEEIRAWGVEHAVPASGVPIGSEKQKRKRMVQSRQVFV